jgi:hypothetical protein
VRRKWGTIRLDSFKLAGWMALKFDLSTMHMGSEFYRPQEGGDFLALCSSSECHLGTIKLINKKQSVDL